MDPVVFIIHCTDLFLFYLSCCTDLVIKAHCSNYVHLMNLEDCGSLQDYVIHHQ